MTDLQKDARKFVVPSRMKPAGVVNNISLSTVQVLTVPSGPYRQVTLQAVAQDIWFTDDGSTTPAVDTGAILKVTDPPLVYTGEVANLQFIEAAASATLVARFEA